MQLSVRLLRDELRGHLRERRRLPEWRHLRERLLPVRIGLHRHALRECGPAGDALASRRDHNGTPLDIELNATHSGDGLSGPTVDPRQGGITRIEIDFDGAVTLADTSKVEVVGRPTSGGSMGSPSPVTPDAVVTVDSDTIAILFNTPLADNTCYNVTLQSGLIAEVMTGDLDVNVRELIGDSTGSGDLNLSDAVLIYTHSGQNASDGPQWDIDLSGTVDNGDVQAAKSGIVSPSSQTLCP